MKARHPTGDKPWHSDQEWRSRGMSPPTEPGEDDDGLTPEDRAEVAAEFARNAGLRPPCPNGEAAAALPPILSREDRRISAWINKDIPLRDYLMGGVMCTTSRWLIVGQTGVGKTLTGGHLAGAISSGEGFLNWAGQGAPRTVMYLDGELPQETFKERMQIIATRYGEDIPLYGYNREALGDDGMPPLNTEPGQKWLRHEIDFIKPDAIFFDSIFCLLQGSLKDEESWAPMKAFVRELTARRIAQVWFNHANDLDKSFGDKTRGWEMDTIVSLTKANPENDDDTAIRLEFDKARLRVPANFEQFKPLIIKPGEEWSIASAQRRGKNQGANQDLPSALARSEFPKTYDYLANGKDKVAGNGQKSSVIKVKVDDILEEMKDRHFIEAEKGAVTSTGRSHFGRAKAAALKKGFQARGEFIWRE